MKKVKYFLIAAFLVVSLNGAAYAQNNVKMGYIDLSKVFDEYEKTKEYDKVLEAEHQQYTQQRDEKINKIKDAQSKMALMKEDEKAKLQEEMDKMREDLLEFDQQQKTDLTKKRDEKIREILLEIEKIVSEYAQKEGYGIVLNDRVLIYGQPSYELTDQILKNLNDSYKKK